MKNIPNIITSVRLFAALAIIVMCLTSKAADAGWFLPLFIAAAISDMLDGYVARRFRWCTEFGAHLDSISDMTLYAAVFVCFLAFRSQGMAICAPVFITGIIVQIAHWIFSVQKHKQFPAYHSTLSRVVAYAMFFICLIFWTTKSAMALGMMLSFWIICSIEGMLITHFLNCPRSNVSSIRKALSYLNAH